MYFPQSNKHFNFDCLAYSACGRDKIKNPDEGTSCFSSLTSGQRVLLVVLCDIVFFTFSSSLADPLNIPHKFPPDFPHKELCQPKAIQKKRSWNHEYNIPLSVNNRSLKKKNLFNGNHSFVAESRRHFNDFMPKFMSEKTRPFLFIIKSFSITVDRSRWLLRQKTPYFDNKVINVFIFCFTFMLYLLDH